MKIPALILPLLIAANAHAQDNSNNQLKIQEKAVDLAKNLCEDFNTKGVYDETIIDANIEGATSLITRFIGELGFDGRLYRKKIETEGIPRKYLQYDFKSVLECKKEFAKYFIKDWKNENCLYAVEFVVRHGQTIYLNDHGINLARTLGNSFAACQINCENDKDCIAFTYAYSDVQGTQEPRQCSTYGEPKSQLIFKANPYWAVGLKEMVQVCR